MDKIYLCYVILICKIFHCHGVSFREQLEHIIETRRESRGENVLSLTRRNSYNSILGTPSMASHLPEAEAILPAHTLLRPALGMLKSAIKFPHRDPGHGAGVYGNPENLGIRYNGQNKRVLYSGFRRALADYLMVAPEKSSKTKKKFVVSSTVLDLDNKKHIDEKLLRLYQVLNDNERKAKRRKKVKLSQKLIQLFPPEASNAEKTPKFNERTAHRSLNSNRVRPKYIRTSSNVVKRLGKSVSKVGNKTSKHKNDLRDDEVDSDNQSNSLETGDNSSVQYLNFRNSTEEDDEKDSKQKWFWGTKDAYNHIKISHDAPEQDELMPVKYNFDDSVRKWWFYHQDDFKPFGDDKDV